MQVPCLTLLSFGCNGLDNKAEEDRPETVRNPDTALMSIETKPLVYRALKEARQNVKFSNEPAAARVLPAIALFGTVGASLETAP